ncbi:MAG: hypothetical protein JWP41_1723, partial [Ramlibacter sp.]|nr:hypothetical protein [Ramlibacter sp.]
MSLLPGPYSPTADRHNFSDRFISTVF